MFGRFYLIILLILGGITLPVAAQNFVIEDIRIDGLQRVSANTVFTALPIKVDQEVSTEKLQDAVREVFKTGFFSDIKIAKEGNVLIISVVERPVINTIDIIGNSVIKTEPLLEGLKNIGLSEGDIFKQAAVERIDRQLNAQYSAVGRYATDIDISVVEIMRNQVNISIDIIEGKVANIKHINIVGNKKFNDEELQDFFQIKKTGTWSWVTGNDKYAQQKLAGDIESLRVFYFDQGYLEFETTSTQVSLNPAKDEVYITVNVFEGEPYTLSDVDISGDVIIPLEEAKSLVTVKEGDVFSQKLLVDISNAFKKRLANEGYSFANVNGVPELNKDSKTAAVTFFVNPGTINYVRRILFTGNYTTQDNVLRREMRQLEGAPISADKLDQSKLRLERLPHFSSVTVATQPVPGRPDQVDIVFNVVEQPSGSVNASIGYSQGSGVVFGAGLQQSNWLGTGNTFGFNVEHSDVETSYTVNFDNPYFTPDGVSRGIDVFYKTRDLNELDISSYAMDRVGVNLSFGYPISENSRVSLGVGVENISITAGAQAVQEIISSPRLRTGDVDNAYVSSTKYNNVRGQLNDTNANGFFDEGDSINSGVTAGTSDGSVQASQEVAPPITGYLNTHGDDFNTLNLSLGLSNSTLNRGVFPTYGHSQRFNVEISTPGGDLEYYKLDYKSQIYRPLSSNLTLRLKSRIGYADSYGNEEFPFFENFFSGGTGSVRGFESSSLGPKGTAAISYVAVPYTRANNNTGFAYVEDTNGRLLTHTDTRTQTLGGNVLLEAGVELIFPVPFARKSKSLRSLFFVDAGNVFSDSCGPNQTNCSKVDLGKLSSATGIGLQWLSPVGPFSIYFSTPLQKQPEDKTETFQLSLGQRF